MELVKIKSFEEIDDIVAMIITLHAGDKFFSITEFLVWVCLNLPLANFQAWKIVADEGKIVGYAITQVVQRYFSLECQIVDAYTEINDVEFSKKQFEFFETWAKERGCISMLCVSKRGDALSKRYDFESQGTILRKRL